MKRAAARHPSQYTPSQAGIIEEFKRWEFLQFLWKFGTQGLKLLLQKWAYLCRVAGHLLHDLNQFTRSLIRRGLSSCGRWGRIVANLLDPDIVAPDLARKFQHGLPQAVRPSLDRIVKRGTAR